MTSYGVQTPLVNVIITTMTMIITVVVIMVFGDLPSRDACRDTATFASCLCFAS